VLDAAAGGIYLTKYGSGNGIGQTIERYRQMTGEQASNVIS